MVALTNVSVGVWSGKWGVRCEIRNAYSIRISTLLAHPLEKVVVACMVGVGGRVHLEIMLVAQVEENTDIFQRPKSSLNHSPKCLAGQTVMLGGR